jgi:hypothetical protein
LLAGFLEKSYRKYASTNPEMVVGFGSSFAGASWAKIGLIATAAAAVTNNFFNIVMLFF